MQLGDVGMIEGGLHLDLALKAFCQFGIAFDVWQQHLHGFDALGNQVLYFVNLAHPALSKNFDDFVIANTLADIHEQTSVALAFSPDEWGNRWPKCYHRQPRA